jgi:PASTA domain
MSGTSRRPGRHYHTLQLSLYEAAGVATILAALLALLTFLGVGPLRLLSFSPNSDLPVLPTSTVAPIQQPAMTSVPTVTGLPEARAVAALRQAGFGVRAQFTPATDGVQVGVVVGQAPAAGSPVQAGATVAIVVGTTSDRQ